MEKKIDPSGFEAFLVKAFNFTTEDLASLYNEAGELSDFALIEKRNAEKISKFQSDSKNQYSRGLKEAAQKIEKELKEKYEIDSDLIGVELLDHIIETKLSEAKDTKGEDIMKHPDVIKLLNQHSKEKKQLAKEWQEKLELKEKEVSQASLFQKVKAAALAEFRNLNPVLPEDAKKAQALEDVLISNLSKFQYQEDGDGFIVLNADGVALTTEHGHDVSFQDHIRGHAERYFDFKKSEERSSAGNKPPVGGGSKVRMPKDQNEYVAMMQDQTLTPKERVELKDLWLTKK